MLGIEGHVFGRVVKSITGAGDPRLGNLSSKPLLALLSYIVPAMRHRAKDAAPEGSFYSRSLCQRHVPVGQSRQYSSAVRRVGLLYGYRLSGAAVVASQESAKKQK